ncbi:uncharacterized protein LOC132926396 [Rhopalosiphum padi]|uniref:uncharacterized protein LOC132926396 n=1 Tax=Rhopalosiphum padi TaxID=40932 RepID=UPI00298E8DB6|nr:uncharacterized protein LOC132926396 [Rhopalosiphum padi]
MRPYINISSDVGRTSQLPSPQATSLTRTRRKHFRSLINNYSVSEKIDLTSPTSSPARTTHHNTVIHPTNTEKYQGTAILARGNMRPYINASSDLSHTLQLPSPQATSLTRTRRKHFRSLINNYSVSEKIDLTSPTSSPAPTTYHNTVIDPTNTEEYQGTEIVPQGHMPPDSTSFSDLSHLPPPPMAILLNPIFNHDVMSYSNEMYQNFIEDGSNNSRELQQYQQQQLTYTQTRRTIVNSSTLNESIDLISPPTSPDPTTQLNTVSHPTFTEELQNHEEIIHDSSNISEYQGTEIVPQGHMPPDSTSFSDLSHLPPPPMAILLNPIFNHDVMSYSNEMYQNFIEDGSNNSRELQQYQQQQLTYTQTRRTIVNSSTLNESIDLISSPTSPDPTTQLNTVSHPSFTEEYLNHIEIMMHDSFSSTEYQIFVTEINREKIYCINSMPYDSTILMIGLKYLISEHLPMGSVTKCVNILQNGLKIQLTRADSAQLNLLFVQRIDVLMNPENAMMVRVQDLKPVFKQLKSLMRLPCLRISNV